MGPMCLRRKKGMRPKLEVGDRTEEKYPGPKHSFQEWNYWVTGQEYI